MKNLDWVCLVGALWLIYVSWRYRGERKIAVPLLIVLVVLWLSTRHLYR